MAGFNPATGQKNDPRFARAVFVASGMGPVIGQSVNTDGRILQQLVDIRPQLVNDQSSVQIVFNDATALMPAAARQMGASFRMPLPTRARLETQAFATLRETLLVARNPAATQRAEDTVSLDEVNRWRHCRRCEPSWV